MARRRTRRLSSSAMRPSKPRWTFIKSIDGAVSDCDEIMRLLRTAFRVYLCLLPLVFALPFLTGCGSDTPPTGPVVQAAGDNHLRLDPLQIGDEIKIDFSGAPSFI